MTEKRRSRLLYAFLIAVLLVGLCPFATITPTNEFNSSRIAKALKALYGPFGLVLLPPTVDLVKSEVLMVLYGPYGRPDVKSIPIISDEEKVRLDNLAAELAKEYEPNWMPIMTDEDSELMMELVDQIREINGEEAKIFRLNDDQSIKDLKNYTAQRKALTEQLDVLVPKMPITPIDPDVRERMENAKQRLFESDIPWFGLSISAYTGKLLVEIDIYAAQNIDDEIRQITGDIPLDIRYRVNTGQLNTGQL